MQIAESNVVKTAKKRSGYLPTLDGWRAIAILAVIFTHDSLHTLGPFSTRWFYEYGNKGVDVFFAISGILICSRLLEEEHFLGRISLGHFYLRRAFRILPAAITYLLAVALLGMAGRIFVYKGEWFGALLFYRNYTRLLGHVSINHEAWFTGHFWSLSVEEHFYLLLPSLLVFLKKGARIPVFSLMALLVIANRAFQLHSRPWDLISFHTDTRLDALLIPALLAIIVRTTASRSHIYSALKFWPIIALVTLAVIPIAPDSFWETTALVFLMPAVIMGSILHPHNILGRLLESPPFRFIGRISYSLYLWQMLFFTGHHYQKFPLGRLEKWPLNIIATFLCALASFYLVEKPMMRLGHKLAPPATPGREDLSATDTAPSSAEGKIPVLT